MCRACAGDAERRPCSDFARSHREAMKQGLPHWLAPVSKASYVGEPGAITFRACPNQPETITVAGPDELPYWLKPVKPPTLAETITRLARQVVRDEQTGETWPNAEAYVKARRLELGWSND